MKTTKKLTLTALCLVVLCAGFTVFQLMRHQNHTRMTGANLTEPASDLYSGENDEQFYDTDSILVITNKKHALPAGYEPKDLVRPQVEMLNECFLRSLAASALEEMFAAADNAGVHLVLGSGYRAESLQKLLYDGYVEQYGREVADYISSRPGYSDHQTGLAVDIADHDALTYLTEAFADTPEGVWLKEHAHEFGFVMRYPKDREDITGFAYEPWHFRYVGTEAAGAIHEQGEWYTLEEYCRVEGGSYGD